MALVAVMTLQGEQAARLLFCSLGLIVGIVASVAFLCVGGALTAGTPDAEVYRTNQILSQVSELP